MSKREEGCIIPDAIEYFRGMCFFFSGVSFCPQGNLPWEISAPVTINDHQLGTKS